MVVLILLKYIRDEIDTLWLTSYQKIQYLFSNSEKEILYSVENNDITIIIAETGIGKTTRMYLNIQKSLNFLSKADTQLTKE